MGGRGGGRIVYPKGGPILQSQKVDSTFTITKVDPRNSYKDGLYVLIPKCGTYVQQFLVLSCGNFAQWAHVAISIGGTHVYNHKRWVPVTIMHKRCRDITRITTLKFNICPRTCEA